MSASFTLCMRVYERDRTMSNDLYARLACQYRAGHDGECSWADVRRDDLASLPPDPDRFPVERWNVALEDILAAITAGDFDRELELILSVGHARKHARRGTFGFTRRTRRLRGQPL